MAFPYICILRRQGHQILNHKRQLDNKYQIFSFPATDLLFEMLYEGPKITTTHRDKFTPSINKHLFCITDEHFYSSDVLTL